MKNDTPQELNPDQEIGRLIDEVMSSSLTDEQYRKKMQRRKEVQDKRIAEAVPEKGLIIVNTGNGKGKTTAALGMVLRSLGHGYKVAIIQFIKGSWEPSEKRVFSYWEDQIEFHAMGEGFTWETQDRDFTQWAKALPGKLKTAIASNGRRLYLGNSRPRSRP